MPPSSGSLHALTVADVISFKEAARTKRQVVSLEHNQTVAHALKVMWQWRALSCVTPCNRLFPLRLGAKCCLLHALCTLGECGALRCAWRSKADHYTGCAWGVGCSGCSTAAPSPYVGVTTFDPCASATFPSNAANLQGNGTSMRPSLQGLSMTWCHISSSQ
jgi:hypothetical protein